MHATQDFPIEISLILSTLSCLMVVFPHNAFPTTNSLILLGYHIANQIPGAQISPQNVPYLEKQCTFMLHNY